MNKELITKYNYAFNKWINGVDVAIKYKDTNYYEASTFRDTNFNWSNPEDIEDIVVHDKYFAFRLALRKGHQVQVYKDKWIDVNNDNDFDIPLGQFRINYSIEIGDWIVDKKRENAPFIATEEFIVGDFNTKDFEKWHPIENEWLWARDHEGGHSLLCQFSKMSNDGKYVVYCAGVLEVEDTYITEYKFCEPFVGTQPSNYHKIEERI